jgi:uracil-DNA glycosylase
MIAEIKRPKSVLPKRNRSANHVAICLGKLATISVTLFSFMEKDPHGQNSAKKDIEDWGQDESETLKSLEAFVHTCHPSWWNRIWLQQEYKLAQTNQSSTDTAQFAYLFC